LFNILFIPHDNHHFYNEKWTTTYFWTFWTNLVWNLVSSYHLEWLRRVAHEWVYAVFTLPETSSVTFQRCLIDYAVSRSTTVVKSIWTTEDYDPPREPAPDAPTNVFRNYEKIERINSKYQENRFLVWATLFQRAAEPGEWKCSHNYG